MNEEKKGETTLGLGENIEGLLCYFLGWVTGVIFLLIEKENEFVRFHAMKSIITFLLFFIVSVAVQISIPFISILIAILIGPLTFILWIVLMLKAFQGEKFKLPLIGDFAEEQIKK